MRHKIEKLLLDIRLSCEEIHCFLSGKTPEEFLDDRLLQLALEREFEIIGEALNRLERIDRDNLEKKVPEYVRIIGFRNVITHGYDVIDQELLLDFALNKVPALREAIENY